MESSRRDVTYVVLLIAKIKPICLNQLCINFSSVQKIITKSGLYRTVFESGLYLIFEFVFGNYVVQSCYGKKSIRIRTLLKFLWFETGLYSSQDSIRVMLQLASLRNIHVIVNYIYIIDSYLADQNTRLKLKWIATAFVQCPFDYLVTVK